MNSFNENLDRIPTEVKTPPSQDDIVKAELQSALLLYSLETAKVRRFITNTTLRKSLSYWAAGIITIWLLVIPYILINNRYFCLSDSVLNTLLTTTTINVLGIIIICFRDLFNGKSEDKIRG